MSPRDKKVLAEVEVAIRTLRRAKKAGHIIYLKGCVQYIKNMKPASLEDD